MKNECSLGKVRAMETSAVRFAEADSVGDHVESATSVKIAGFKALTPGCAELLALTPCCAAFGIPS